MITEVTGPSRQRRGPGTCPVNFEEPGKLADMVVLSGDFLGCSDEDFDNLVVDLTLLGGEVAFER